MHIKGGNIFLTILFPLLVNASSCSVFHYFRPYLSICLRTKGLCVHNSGVADEISLTLFTNQNNEVVFLMYIKVHHISINHGYISVSSCSVNTTINVIQHRNSISHSFTAYIKSSRPKKQTSQTAIESV